MNSIYIHTYIHIYMRPSSQRDKNLAQGERSINLSINPAYLLYLLIYFSYLFIYFIYFTYVFTLLIYLFILLMDLLTYFIYLLYGRWRQEARWTT